MCCRALGVGLLVPFWDIALQCPAGQRIGIKRNAGNHRPDGPEADHSLTFNPDHSMGAVDRVALANGELAERLAHKPPEHPRQAIVSPFVAMPLFQRTA